MIETHFSTSLKKLVREAKRVPKNVMIGWQKLRIRYRYIFFDQ